MGDGEQGVRPPGPITLDQLLALNEEIAALVRAGVPLDRGLLDAGGDVRGRLGRIAGVLARRLNRGEELGRGAGVGAHGDPAPVPGGRRGGDAGRAAPRGAGGPDALHPRPDRDAHRDRPGTVVSGPGGLHGLPAVHRVGRAGGAAVRVGVRGPGSGGRLAGPLAGSVGDDGALLVADRADRGRRAGDRVGAVGDRRWGCAAACGADCDWSPGWVRSWPTTRPRASPSCWP